MLRYLHELNTDEDYLSFVKSQENNTPKPFDEETLENLSQYLAEIVHVITQLTVPSCFYPTCARTQDDTAD